MRAGFWHVQIQNDASLSQQKLTSPRHAWAMVRNRTAGLIDDEKPFAESTLFAV
jgi:hypothetical protein